MAFLHVNHASLHYRVQGESAPVIALHGSASTGAQWRSLAGYLEGRFQIFTPDLPGYGQSPACDIPGRGLRRTQRQLQRWSTGSARRCILSAIPLAARWR